MKRNKRRRGESPLVSLIIDRWESLNERSGRRKYYTDVQVRLTRDEFIDWSLQTPELKKVFDDWTRTLDNRLKPSIDRINARGHYELGNLRWTTFSENSRLGARGFRRRIPVGQYTINGTLIQKFVSAAEAARSLNCCSVGISVCAAGKQKTSCGYVWKYVI